MINVNELRACIARAGYTQKRLAAEIGMSKESFARKMKHGVFGTDEAERVILVLHIDNPGAIFFAPKVT